MNEELQVIVLIPVANAPELAALDVQGNMRLEADCGHECLVAQASMELLNSGARPVCLNCVDAEHLAKHMRVTPETMEAVVEIVEALRISRESRDS